MGAEVLLGVLGTAAMVGIGLFHLITAAHEWGLPDELRRSGVVAQGTVVEYRAAQERPGGWVTFALTTQDGRMVLVRDPNHLGGRLRTGDPVTVAYLPSAPERARLVGTGRGFTLIAGLWGVVSIGAGVVVAIVTRRVIAHPDTEYRGRRRGDAA